MTASMLAIVGGGPAGLMAAEAACTRGARVDLYDAMPSVGRKFLLAGRGGLNLTHAEPFEAFLTRYGARQGRLAPLLADFGPEAVRAWALSLGVETFVGTSRRVFPTDLKAAPLLRAWLRRLRRNGVQLHVRHRWLGWDERGRLEFATPGGLESVRAGAVVLALGGGSWPRLGSDGRWVSALAERGVSIAPLRPANCGFNVRWSEHFRNKFAGQPLQWVAVSMTDENGRPMRRAGHCTITEHGLEGGVIYDLAAALRELVAARGATTVFLDLAPDRERERLVSSLSCPRGSRTTATHLARRAGVTGVKAGLLREVLTRADMLDAVRVASAIKALPLTVVSPRPLEEAISTAGGVRFEELDERLMIRRLPGTFCAGEMLDWEAPTGGYLLTACLASGRTAGFGAAEWLARQPAGAGLAETRRSSEMPA